MIIIVLGNKLKPNGEMSNTLLNRLDLVANVFNKKCSTIIVSGGRVQKKSKHTEAYLMKKYLVQKHNIPPNIIVKEPKSKDTIQNAIYTLRIVNHLDKQQLCVISSQFHIPRVKIIFNYFFNRSIKYHGAKNGISGKQLIEIIRHEKKNLINILLKKNIC